jgi:hypothetical protein
VENTQAKFSIEHLVNFVRHCYKVDSLIVDTIIVEQHKPLAENFTFHITCTFNVTFCTYEMVSCYISHIPFIFHTDYVYFLHVNYVYFSFYILPAQIHPSAFHENISLYCKNC